MAGWYVYLALGILAFLLARFFWHHVYQPPEDCLGVIYRRARLHRIISPDDWAFLIPGLDEPRDPVSLRLRQVEVSLSRMLTRDHIPMDATFLVAYWVDPTRVNRAILPQVLAISPDGWHEIVRASVQEVAGEVINGLTSRNLLGFGRSRFKRALSMVLADRLHPLGVIIDPVNGLSLQALQPASEVWNAMMEQKVAAARAEAMRARLAPVLEALHAGNTEAAWSALLWACAAVAAEQGVIPEVVVTPSDGIWQHRKVEEMLVAVLHSILRPVEVAASQVEEDIRVDGNGCRAVK